MRIELFSFIFGMVMAMAIVIVVEYSFGKIFGNKKLRQLNREVKRLQAVIKKKDELIAKSLIEIQRAEVKDGRKIKKI